MKISKKSKILSISHKDLDGCCSQIILGNAFDKDKIEYREAKYNEIDSIMKSTSYDKYDYVILTDISPSEERYLDISDNIILLDHHDTALKYNNISKKRLVDNSSCATKLTKRFVEVVLDINISYLEDLVNLTNDYDMWIHSDPRSKQLNDLYFKYWGLKFRRRFFEGVVDFNPAEIKFLKEIEINFRKLWETLDVYTIESINGAFIQSHERVNDLCDKLLKEEGYNIVFCRNDVNGTISVRATYKNIHLGNMFQQMGIGGGHKNSAGLNIVSMKKFKDIINTIENEILRIQSENV